MTHTFIYQPPTQPWLDVLYQDKDLIVLNKPSGLLTNPGRGEHLADCLLSRVQQQYPQALLVHRLDMATSGVVVMALRRKAEAALKQQFAARSGCQSRPSAADKGPVCCVNRPINICH